MKLAEALGIISKGPVPEAELLQVALVCGFTPLHLQSFLQAELQLRFPQRRIEIITGQYGDIAGSLKTLAGKPIAAVALIVEWADLDPRLGIRTLGGWGPANLQSVHEQTTMRLSQLRLLVEQLATSVSVVVSLPTLALPPIFFTPGWQASAWELALKETLTSFAAGLAQNPKVRFVSEQRLSEMSPAGARLDVKSDWVAGFPYSISHSSALADHLARLIENPLPKKGLITDLDNTLWSGIVGEAGTAEISWDLDHHSQGNGLYQQLLKTLLEEGVLIGVASKNDPGIVEEILKREDFILPLNKVFPLEVSWGSKAGAVSRILSTWNIAADSVVFVDDDPLELAEVQTAHPSMICVRFPRQSSQDIYRMLFQLRELFGRERVSAEDQIRLDSIRASAKFREASADSEGFSEALLEQAEPELLVCAQKNAGDSRALELLNKTNQFNLNGKRFTEAEWNQFLSEDDTFVVTATYQDRFGPLGKIAVIAGRRNGKGVAVDSWVMSCRAFARRIEHQCLKFLFDTFNCDSISFDYQRTPKNGPLASFFSELLQKTPPSNPEISKERFEEVCPRLFHRVREVRE